MSTTRQDWEFQYSISAIVAAATMRKNYHRSRVDHWLAEFEKVKASLPETITIESAEAFALAASVSNSSYGSPKLRLDQDLERKFNLATRKVMEHRQNAETYERWIAVLSSELPGRTMSLKMADVEFFSLHDDAMKRLVEQDEKQ